MSKIDEFVPDPQFKRELGGISDMALWRRDHDPKLAELGWPVKIKIGHSNYRSRNQIEAFKAALLKRAFETLGVERQARAIVERGVDIG